MIRKELVIDDILVGPMLLETWSRFSNELHTIALFHSLFLVSQTYVRTNSNWQSSQGDPSDAERGTTIGPQGEDPPATGTGDKPLQSCVPPGDAEAIAECRNQTDMRFVQIKTRGFGPLFLRRPLLELRYTISRSIPEVVYLDREF